jgi:GntR family transcriptional regulator
MVQSFLDKHSPVPLYHQLTERIRSEIQHGVVKPGDLIGTEKEMIDRYQVSRATVRKALDELTRDGLVVRITGRGTFVASPRLTVDLPNLLSFTEEMRRRGMTAGAVLHEFRVVPCPGSVAQALTCQEGEEILFIRRVRTGDAVPIVVVNHYLAPFVRLHEDELGQSLYETIERNYGLRLQEAHHTIRAGLSTHEEADWLGIGEGDAVLRFLRTTFTGDGRPVLFETGSARADIYEYSVHLTR